jgi:hypothetical protein
MNAYFVTIPITFTEEQRKTAEAAGWRVAVELQGDVMSAAVPSTVIEVSEESPEQAAGVVAQAFGQAPDELRVEERQDS